MWLAQPQSSLHYSHARERVYHGGGHAWYLRHPIAVLTVGFALIHGSAAGLLIGLASLVDPATDFGPAGNFCHGLALGMALCGSLAGVAGLVMHRYIPRFD